MTDPRISELGFVSRETQERLAIYHDELTKWTAKINLISRNTTQHIWERHILDSLQLWSYLPNDAQTWTDLGSGGGLPVIPLACVAAQTQPSLAFHAVESDQRKCAFLRHMAHRLSLSLTIHNARLESAPNQNADVVSARALAPLGDLLGYCNQHLSKHGHALLLKGANHTSEIDRALEHWRFSVQTIPSITDSAAVILKIKDIVRV